MLNIYEDGVNDDISEVSIVINDVLNLICGVSVLAFMMICLPEALLTPQNEGANIDSGSGVNNYTSPKVRISTKKIRISTKKFRISTKKFHISTKKFRISTKKFRISTKKFRISTKKFRISTKKFRISTKKIRINVNKVR